MKNDKRQAATNAACAIAAGIMLDQVSIMRDAGAFNGRADEQAGKVMKHCQSVMNSLPPIRSARGKKNIKLVCDAHHESFLANYAGIRDDSAMAAVCAIFSAHHAITELRRVHGLKSQSWTWLDQTSTTLVDMMIKSFPDEESRMWATSLPVVAKLEEMAA